MATCKTVLKTTLSMVVLAFALNAMAVVGSAQSERPNVILVMTDDQGYGDISAHGNPKLETPNLDAMYRESVRLTDFHVDPTCSPTRAALMTGQYSHRVNVWHTIMGRNHLLLDQPTMGRVFQQNGYDTALFGKWHLGAKYPYRPMDRGFEEWLGQGDGGTGTVTDYWGNDRVDDTYIHNGEYEQIDGWTTDVFFEQAMQYIKQDRKDPFFIYLATYVPHSPHTLPDKPWADKYNSHFFSSIARIDHNLGRLRSVLEEEELAENTIVIFLTDNGGTVGVSTFNAGMRGRKGSVYEGGHRVPCFIHWPGGDLAQPRDVDRLTAHFDLLPTLIDLCGLTPPDNANFDGRSLKPLLYDPDAEFQDRTLVVESQRHNHTRKWRRCTVMTERWRLVKKHKLYNIKKDPGQETDVSDEHPDVVKRLRRFYEEQYWPSVSKNDDQFPRPVLGTEHQRELDLRSENYIPIGDPDKRLQPWAQSHVMQGKRGFGSWPIRVATEGVYRFEVRRWPREADAPLNGKVTFDKEVDAYLRGGGINTTIYGGKNTALPVKKVKLSVGDVTRTKPVRDGQKKCLFTISLPAGPTRVKTWLIGPDGKKLTSAYYTYVRPKTKETSEKKSGD